MNANKELTFRIVGHDTPIRARVRNDRAQIGRIAATVMRKKGIGVSGSPDVMDTRTGEVIAPERTPSELPVEDFTIAKDLTPA
jgi:hypothetical protein